MRLWPRKESGAWHLQWRVCFTPYHRDAVSDWIKKAKLGQDDYVFPGRIHESHHIGTRQYARSVDSGGTEIGLNPSEYGTHLMQRTKASLIYRRTKNLRAVQLPLGHTSLETAVRCLDIGLLGGYPGYPTLANAGSV